MWVLINGAEVGYDFLIPVTLEWYIYLEGPLVKVIPVSKPQTYCFSLLLSSRVQNLSHSLPMRTKRCETLT